MVKAPMPPGQWSALQHVIASKIGLRDAEVCVARPLRTTSTHASTVQVPFYVQGASVCAVLDQHPDHTATCIHRGLRLIRLGLLKSYWQRWRLNARRLTEQLAEQLHNAASEKRLQDGNKIIA